MNDTVSTIAIKDISTYYNNLGKYYFYVTELRSKTTTRLNRELGVHNINYFGNTNNGR